MVTFDFTVQAKINRHYTFAPIDDDGLFNSPKMG